MPAYQDITLTDDSAQSRTMTCISVQDQKSIRRDMSLPLATPFSLTISHQTFGKGLTGSDRHLFRIDQVKEDTEVDDIATLSGSVYIVIDQPRRIFADADIASMVQMCANYVVANLSALTKGAI